MSSRLEKARKDPNSMKAKILSSARKLFGEYGYNDTTTRMIAYPCGANGEKLVTCTCGSPLPIKKQRITKISHVVTESAKAHDSLNNGRL